MLAIDSSLATDYQTLMYPYNISFPNLNAFNALGAQQVAVITLSATLTVQVPTGGDTNNNATDSPVTVTCKATIELAKGENPRMENLNPTSPLSYPSWLSYDLRIFTVTSGQSHDMFSVASPTDATQAVSYIRQVLNNLNNPTQITNGDTFDNALTQSEEASAVPWLPAQGSDPAQFAFAIARVRIKSSVTETIGPVRVFFRLFSAASTITNFAEVGKSAGTYRWGTNGTAGHKIPLLGVESNFFFSEYVTVPCFATDRVNLNGPADMKTQTDPPNAVNITTIANTEVDTYFGCWLDVNQTTKFLIPTPPGTQSQWDGPWTGTESLNGAIAVAPHQCLVAEIRFDDTPIATTRTHGHHRQARPAQHCLARSSAMTSHPFEIKPSATNQGPDVLMVTWRGTPAQSVAEMYLPAVSSKDIIALADKIYGRHRLTATDANTIQFPASDLTLIPITAGIGRYAGLLSVDARPSMPQGKNFTVAVRQLNQVSATTRTKPTPAPPRVALDE